MKARQQRGVKGDSGPCLEAAFDTEHLRRYTFGDRTLEQELLGLFRIQARLQLDLIAAARCEADFRSSVHTLKGAALALGARDIVATTISLEELGFGAATALRHRLIARLRREIEAAEAAIGRIRG